MKRSPTEYTDAPLIEDIIRKKELRTISLPFVQHELQNFLKRKPQLFQLYLKNSSPKSNAHKTIVKEMRAHLRKIYGLFRQEDISHITTLVDELPLSSQPEKIISQILQLHSSTKEREYHLFWKKLFALTNNPKTILDLGCGVHPFSLWYVKDLSLQYHAHDLSTEEISLLQKFFSFLQRCNKKFQGEAHILDILNPQVLAHLPSVDLALLLKMTDVLDRGKGHKKTEEIITSLPAKYVVVSFSTKTMSGKEMTAPERKWMHWLCQRLHYTYEIFTLNNELFYVIKKK